MEKTAERFEVGDLGLDDVNFKEEDPEVREVLKDSSVNPGLEGKPCPPDVDPGARRWGRRDVGAIAFQTKKGGPNWN